MKCAVFSNYVTIGGFVNQTTQGELTFYKNHSQGQKTYCCKKMVCYNNQKGAGFKRHVDTGLETLSAKQLQFLVNKFAKENNYCLPKSLEVDMFLTLVSECDRSSCAFIFKFINHQCYLTFARFNMSDSFVNNISTNVKSMAFKEMLVSAKRLLKNTYGIEFDVNKV